MRQQMTAGLGGMLTFQEQWEGDRLSAWVSTQAVHATREGVAKALDLTGDPVRLDALETRLRIPRLGQP